MNSLHHITVARTGFPFGFSREDYEVEQRFRESRDLLRELETAQWIALDAADKDDGTRDYMEYQIPVMAAEVDRRFQLLKHHRNDPLAPTWPRRDSYLRQRVKTVKTVWPIERFCRDCLMMNLIPVGLGRWKGRCPLPGHPDRTPSFFISTECGLGYCHGCHRGGDVIKLAQYVLNADRFMDALEALEREGGLQ